MPTIVKRLLPAGTPGTGRSLPPQPVPARAGASAPGCRGGNVDLIRVTQVAEEMAGKVVIRPYPKTRVRAAHGTDGAFLVGQLRVRLGAQPAEPGQQALVLAIGADTPLRRSNFRRQVWPRTSPPTRSAGCGSTISTAHTRPGEYRVACRPTTSPQ